MDQMARAAEAEVEATTKVEVEETMLINKINIKETNLMKEKEEEDEAVIRQSQQTSQTLNAIYVTSMVTTSQSVEQICPVHMGKSPILQKKRESKLERYHCSWYVVSKSQPTRTCGI